MELNEIHDCEKCHGKIVMITTDAFGNSKCGYCGEMVDYTLYFEDNKRFKQFIKSWEKENGLKT